MASYTARKNKAGEIVSYQIKVTRGRDKLTGKQLTPFTTTYTPPDGWSKRAIERDLVRFMGEFEAACKRGEILTKEEQKALAEQQAKQEQREKAEAESKPTFNQYVEIFLKDKAVTLSPTTIQNYRKGLKRSAEVFGEMKLEDIDHIMIKRFITDLQGQQRSRKNEKPLAHGTVGGYYTILHTLFESAVDDEIIPANPMARVKKPKPRKDEIKKEPVCYSESEVDYIIQCLNN